MCSCLLSWSLWTVLLRFENASFLQAKNDHTLISAQLIDIRAWQRNVCSFSARMVETLSRVAADSEGLGCEACCKDESDTAFEKVLHASADAEEPCEGMADLANAVLSVKSDLRLHKVEQVSL